VSPFFVGSLCALFSLATMKVSHVPRGIAACCAHVSAVVDRGLWIIAPVAPIAELAVYHKNGKVVVVTAAKGRSASASQPRATYIFIESVIKLASCNPSFDILPLPLSSPHSAVQGGVRNPCLELVVILGD
jgi:hypothetical protein